MTITDVRIRMVKGSEEDAKLKAYVDVTFDNCLAVHGLKIIEGQDRMFIAMPSKRIRVGEFKDIIHPVQADFRREITDIIIAKYKELEGSIEE